MDFWRAEIVMQGASRFLRVRSRTTIFWDNPTYELTMLGFGPGVVARLPVLTHASWYTVLHLDLVPFGGNNKVSGPDTSQIGDFNFGGGAEAKLESTLSFGNAASS